MKCPKCSALMIKTYGRQNEPYAKCTACGKVILPEMVIVKPEIPPNERTLSTDEYNIRKRENMALRKNFKRTINQVEVIRI